MPDWGLTAEQRETNPWGLPVSVLRPGKVFTDPVHGDIHLNVLEVAVVDAAPYQRLRRVRQLGMTHLVYPGAVHTRFSHGLGTLRVAQMLLDTVWVHRSGLHRTEDLFAQWERTNAGQLQARWAKATVAARLGALLHDLCHVPAGHTVEDDLRALVAHDANVPRFNDFWRQVRRDVRSWLKTRRISDADIRAVDDAFLETSGELHQEVRPLIISKGSRPASDRRYPFCDDLVGNTICADLLDYLGRDHLFTGLPHSLGARFISAFFVTPEGGGAFEQRMALNIMRDGVERTDIAGELLKALRYRYELTERALVHHAKLSADAMLGEAIERFEWALWLRAVNNDELMQLHEVGDAPDPDRVPEYRTAYKKRYGTRPANAVQRRVRDQMENLFSTAGDEGLLDFLVGAPGVQDELPAAVTLRAHVAELARDLRERRLFRIGARVSAADASPDSLFERFGSPEARADLERRAQEFIRRDGQAPQVILWVPPPDMRLKLAEVLVKHEAGISPFVAYERSRSRRGSDVYDAHSRLWATYVFVHRQLSEAEAERVVAFLAGEMGVVWERYDHLGSEPVLWPVKLALADVADLDLEPDYPEDLNTWPEQVAARTGGGKTYAALRREVKRLYRRQQGG